MNNITNRKITLEEHLNNVKILAGNNFEVMEISEPMRSRNNTLKHIACGRLFTIHNSVLIKLSKENKEIRCPHCRKEK